jgi:hypothetical protein
MEEGHPSSPAGVYLSHTEISKPPSGGFVFGHQLTALRRHGFDPEIVHPFPGPKLLSYPAWLFAAPGPCFRRFVWISEFRQNRRVRSAMLQCFDWVLDVSRR